MNEDDNDLILGNMTIEQINEIYNDIINIPPNEIIAEGCNINCGTKPYMKGSFGCL